MVHVSPTSPNRPRQVTLAAWLIIGGSLAVVALVFERVAELHSIETREAIARFLAEPPGSDLGLGPDGAVTALRTIAMVAAGCATAAAILGYHVLRRSRSARLGLTVLAAPLFLTGMITGGFVSSVVAAAALMLWLQPARDWFDGVTRSTPAASAPAAATPGTTPGTPPGAPYAPPGPGTVPSGSAPAVARRPAAVLWACCLTWVCAGLTTAALVASGIALALEPDVLFDEARKQNPNLAEQGVTDDMLTAVAYVMIAGIVLWCLAAAVIAVLVLRGIEWARIVLVVSAAATATLCLVGLALGAFVLVVVLVAAVVTVVLLMRPDARSWFARA
jgi:hypothetical protein